MTIPTDHVGTPTLAFMRMSSKWEKILDLLGGTDSMREAGERYLPKEEAEAKDSYDRRIARSFLFGGFKDTVTNLSARPFSKPVTVNGELPPRTEGLIDNADRKGRTLSQMAMDLFEDAIAMGMSHILVDAPIFDSNLSEGEANQAGIGTYLNHIKASQLIGVSFDTDHLSGDQRLMQVRIREFVEVADGEYKQKTMERIRVINAPSGGKGTWEIWERDATLNGLSISSNRRLAGMLHLAHYGGAGEPYRLFSSGTHDFKEIPLFTLYARKVAEYETEPPLMDLADMNIAHWQSGSSQRNILQFARLGLLFARGFREKEADGITAAPNALIHASNPEADLKYVEYQGKAIEAGFKDLAELEAKMERLGLKPLISRVGGTTATTSTIDEARTHSDMQSWVVSLEGVLESALISAAEGNGESLPSDFSVDVFSDFGMSLRSSDDIRSLLEARKAGEISQETFLHELRRRALLAESVDIMDEIERLEQEAPKPTAFNEDGTQNDDQIIVDPKDAAAQAQETAGV